MAINLRTFLYTFPFLLTGVAAIFFAIRLRRSRTIYGAKWITTLLIASTVWSLAQALEYLSPVLETKIFWDNLQWIGISIIPAAFLMLALEIAGKDRWHKVLTVVLIFFIPAIILILVYTNPFHHLIVEEYALIEHAGFIGMDKVYSLGFWLFLGYSYLLFMTGFFYLVWLSLRPQNYYGNQIRWTILAALITVIVSILDTTKLNPFPYFQPTVLAMSSFTLVVAGNMGKLRKKDIHSASSNIFLESIPDPLFLLSDTSTILELNPAAQNLIGRSAPEAVGHPLSKAAPELYVQVSPLLSKNGDQPSQQNEYLIGSIKYHAKLSSNWDNVGRLQSQVLLLSTQGSAHEIASELQRSNALIQALGKVAAQVASVSSLLEVFDTMRYEFHKLSLEFAYISFDRKKESSKVAYASFNTGLLKPLEKIVGQSFIGYTVKRSDFPIILDELEDQYPVFVSDFPEAIQPAYQQIPNPIFLAGLKRVGITNKTAGIFIPINFSDRNSGFLAIWGSSLLKQDLPAFSVFGSQVASAIEQANLLENEQKQMRELERSNALILALTRVAAQASSSFNAETVLGILSDELGALGLDFYLCVVDKEQQFAEIQFISLDLAVMRQVEKIFADTILGFKLPRESWPPLAIKALEQKKSIFVEAFAKDVTQIFHKFPIKMAKRALKLVGIQDNTAGIHVAKNLQDGSTAVLSVWGDDLNESDVATFSIFASQVAIAFENARLFNAEMQQALELERSITLLNALSRIGAGVSSTTEPKELMVVMKNELRPLNLDFVYVKVNQTKDEARIEYISLDANLIKQLQKIANFSLVGRTIPQNLWPLKVMVSSIRKQTLYFDNFSEFLYSLFGGISRRLQARAQQAVGISEDTSGVFLPIALGDGSMMLIIIWGASLREEDLAALDVYRTQMESMLETSRLFHLAEQEIAERRNAQNALIISQAEYRGLFENAHDAILVFDPTTLQVLDANERASAMFGYSQDEFMNVQFDTITENVTTWKEAITNIIQSKEHVNFELVQYCKGNRVPITTEVNAGIVTFKGQQAIQSIHRDVTQRRKMEAQARYDSLHDALTDLPNRTLFLDRLNQVITHSSRTRTYAFAVLFVDLDRFKDINDSMGHFFGDQLLIDLSKRLQTSVRANDTIARMGGDEFVILLDQVNSIDQASGLCERILEIIKQPITIKGNEVIPSGSIGVVMGSPDYMQPEEYLRDADIAMYRAKAGGRDRYDFFDVDMRTSVMERLKLEKNLRKAIDRKEFFLLYQPIINMCDHQIKGFEALIRWQQPELGLISPDDFIPAAEDLGFIHNIGYWVLQEACSQLQGWQAENDQLGDLTLNVNVSALQLLRSDFPDEVKNVLELFKLNPHNLALEITETAFIHNQEIASKQIKALKALGVQIHLDDFGTGFSSLSFINLFQIDALKIERQFIADLGQEKEGELVSAILALGKKLKLYVVAEGIENLVQLDFLRKEGCILGQGYYFSQPVSSKEAALLIQSTN